MKPLLTLILSLAVLSVSAFAGDEEMKDHAVKNESELGIVSAKGNSDIATTVLKHQTKYRANRSTYAMRANYLRSSDHGNESAKSWLLGGRYEYALSDKWSTYAAETVDGDIFSGVRQRYASDLGGKYFFEKSDPFVWFAEGGYRFTHENRIDETLNYSSLRLYSEAERKFTETFSMKYWIEYLPNLTNSTDWQLNTELSLAAALSSVFAMKAGYLVKYDHLPAPGAVKTDRVFVTSVVAKF